jgi:hypothetical protein
VIDSTLLQRFSRVARRTVVFEVPIELERVRGIEPPCAAWEAAVLPLNYTRRTIFDFRFSIAECNQNEDGARKIVWRGRLARMDHCQEITSSSDAPEFLAPEPPVPSLPSDQAITPWLNVAGPAPVSAA